MQSTQTSTKKLAVSATLHCLTGCAIGEIVGLIIGTAGGWSNLGTTGVSIGLAFLFGYTLSSLPLLKAGVDPKTVLVTILAADTLSIATMELVDTIIMLVVPGAMNATLVNPLFWTTTTLALAGAFVAAVPVNAFLLRRGKGHALVHSYHQHK